VPLCISDHPVTNVPNGNHKGQFLWKQRNKKSFGKNNVELVGS
jgi:hypothetical protein